MTTSPNPLAARARELCWRQWTSLGVAGVRPMESNTAIDLEALILLTASLGDLDPRLRDESTDWCVQFGARFVSASRLRNLLAREPAHARPPLLEYLATINANAPTRWPLPAKAEPRVAALSGKSRLPEPRKRPALLRLQLRALFGNTARAELLAAFATSRPGVALSASDLVSTGYSKRNVAVVLADLALAGLLDERKVGNALRYKLDRRADLTSLAPGAATARSTRWDLRAHAIASAVRLIDANAAKPPLLAGVAARQWVLDLATTWTALDLSAPTPDAPASYWTDLVAWLPSGLAPDDVM